MNESRSYNLLDQPWIPVEWISANQYESKIGIRTAFQRAHEIRCISHTAPFIEFGIYRLLIAIALDAYILKERRPTISKMRVMLEKGQFDNSVDDYLNSYSKTFDLWDEENPFLQRRGVNGKKKDNNVRWSP